MRSAGPLLVADMATNSTYACRMGFTFQRREKLGRSYGLNLSKRGGSISKRKGPLTVNSRGGVTIRLGKGFGFRFKL